MHSTTPPSQPITVWLERTNRIAARLQKITGGNAKEYVLHVVEDFLDKYDKDIVYEQIVAVSKLQTSVYRYENEVLTIAGMGPEYDEVRGVTRLVCEVVKWLEEVLCLAMVDAAEVEIMYKESRLPFQ